ncbi:large-conductance mechanosensitive channel [Capnocytophaga ochracea]|uniref:Large-conductance mechanosensitive channel n=1 Tax=Capnocytophaga ochracea TaxID=1018 RepID=A0A2X1H2N6_CAPOC|nr:large-conductance mechanosensitive channel [Capnocytophaga ochracea]
MGFLKEFKEFAVKGNVVDLAIGLSLGLLWCYRIIISV